MQYNRIVLNEPHASIEGLYDERLSFWNVDDKFVNDIVLKWTDWHTDYLFHGYRKENIRTVRFPYSRFIVDAERLWNDPLEAKGQGILCPSQIRGLLSWRSISLRTTATRWESMNLTATQKLQTVYLNINQ